MTKTFTLSRLNKALLGAAGALALSLPAFAQNVETVSERENAANGEIVDEIVVFGSAVSQQRAIESKRESLQILDGISQDDVGRLPDLDTAGALRRIPGVNVQEDQGEPRFPVIRGLNGTFNRVVIDGGIVASPERGTRLVPLDIIPASMLAELQVVKTPTADQDPNAIGGTINLVTRSAFDEESPFFYAQGFIGHVGQNGDGGALFSEEAEGLLPYRVNGAAGTRFGPDEQFGIVLGFNYSRRAFEIPQVEVDDADYTEFNGAGENVGLGNGNGIVTPTNNRLFFYNNNRRQISGHGRLEWRPSDTFRVDLTGFYAEFNDDERRDEFRYELGTSGSLNQPAVIRDQTATTGVSDTGFGIVGLGRFVIDRRIYNGRAFMEWQATPNLTFDTQFVYSGGGLNNPESTEAFQTDTSFGAFFDNSTFFPRFAPLDPEGFFDPANYAHGGRGVLDRTTTEDIIEITPSVAYDTSFGDAEVTLKAGGMYRNREREERGEFTRFNTTLDYTLADAVNLQLNDVDVQGGQRFPFRVDDLGATAFFNDDRSTFSGNPVSPFGLLAEEEVISGFAMATLRSGPFTVVGGVRVENTSFEGQNLRSAGDIAVEGDYTNVLGNFQARWDATDSVVVRAAFTQTIGRPDLSDLATGLNLGSVEADTPSISFGNPDLEPRTSNNVDLSVEWYLPGNGIFAIGGFYKDISNEIFVGSRNDVDISTLPADVRASILDIDSSLTQIDISQPLNSADARIIGLEAQYQQRFDFLPAPFNGFGFVGNVTYVDTEFDIPLSDGSTVEEGLFQQPDLIGNITGYYQTEEFEVRVSYNYAGDFLDSINTSSVDRFEYWEPQGQIDMQARYNISDNFRFLFEAQNLNNEGRTEVTGPDRQFLQESAVFGRTFWFGFGANF